MYPAVVPSICASVTIFLLVFVIPTFQRIFESLGAKIADFYDQEVDAEVHGLTAMIEPIVIVVMGIVVGTIVTAMFLPMFDMPNLI